MLSYNFGFSGLLMLLFVIFGGLIYSELLLAKFVQQPLVNQNPSSCVGSSCLASKAPSSGQSDYFGSALILGFTHAQTEKTFGTFYEPVHLEIAIAFKFNSTVITPSQYLDNECGRIF